MKQSTAWVIGMAIVGGIIGAINSITRKQSEKLTQEAMEKVNDMSKDWFKPKEDPFNMKEHLERMEKIKKNNEEIKKNNEEIIDLLEQLKEFGYDFTEDASD